MKSQGDIIFGLIVEEFNPPPPPAPPKVVTRAVGSGEGGYDRPVFQGGKVTRHSAPLRTLVATLWVSNDQESQQLSSDSQPYIRARLAEQVMNELINTLVVEREYDVACNATRYMTKIYVANSQDMVAARADAATAKVAQGTSGGFRAAQEFRQEYEGDWGGVLKGAGAP